MLVPFVIVVALSFVLVVFVARGAVAAGVLVSLSSLIVAPLTLLSAPGVQHVGIGPAAPALTTYSAAVFICATLCLPKVNVRSVIIWLPFVTWLLVASLVFWPPSAEVSSGVLQLLLAPAAWIFGVFIGGKVLRDGRLAGFYVAVVTTLLCIQLMVCLLQVAGIGINSMDAAQQTMLEGRYNGTLVHPNDLGKVAIFSALTLIPLHANVGSKQKFLIAISVSVTLLLLVLTGGRAVSIGFVFFLVVWFLFQPGKLASSSRFIKVLGISAASLVLFGSMLLSRFDEDPFGGARSTLVDGAFAQIERNPFTGSGANSYVSTVGEFDPLVASGVPVHNAALLTIVEIGSIGLLCLLLPLARTIRTSAKTWNASYLTYGYSRAFLACLPCVYIISTTGWGVLGSNVLPLAMFAFAMMDGCVIQRQSDGLSVPKTSKVSNSPSRRGGYDKISIPRSS